MQEAEPTPAGILGSFPSRPGGGWAAANTGAEERRQQKLEADLMFAKGGRCRVTKRKREAHPGDL